MRENKLCRVCNHPDLERIHSLKKEGKQLKEIVEIYKNHPDGNFSISSLSRHFRHHYDEVAAEIEERKFKLLSKDANTIQTCQKWTDQFLTEAFEAIYENWDYIKRQITFNELVTLAKLRLLLKEGDTSPADSIVTIFNRAAQKYGVEVAQMTLFDNQKSSPFRKVVEVEGEEALTLPQEDKERRASQDA